VRTIDRETLKKLKDYDLDLAVATVLFENANKWLTHEEVAEILNISKEAAQNHLRKILILGWATFRQRKRKKYFKISDWGIKVVKNMLGNLGIKSNEDAVEIADFSNINYYENRRERYNAFLKIFKQLSKNHPEGVTLRVLMEEWLKFLKFNGITMTYIYPEATLYNWLRALEKQGLVKKVQRNVFNYKINFWKYIGDKNERKN